MSRLESFTGSQKQSAEKHGQMDAVGEKAGLVKLWSPPVSGPPHSVLVSCHKGQKIGFPDGDMLSEDDCSLKESVGMQPRVQEKAQQDAVSGNELKRKELKTAQDTVSTQTGRRRHVGPEVNHDLSNEGEEGDDIKVPVELKIEFLRAVTKQDFKLACKLCQMILIYEPENPEASSFLPLIKKELLKEQEAEHSSEEENGDDDSDDSQSDEESSCSSSSSCSSYAPSDDDDHNEDVEAKQLNRHF